MKLSSYLLKVKGICPAKANTQITSDTAIKLNPF